MSTVKVNHISYEHIWDYDFHRALSWLPRLGRRHLDDNALDDIGRDLHLGAEDRNEHIQRLIWHIMNRDFRARLRLGRPEVEYDGEICNLATKPGAHGHCIDEIPLSTSSQFTSPGLLRRASSSLHFTAHTCLIASLTVPSFLGLCSTVLAQGHIHSPHVGQGGRGIHRVVIV